MLSSSPSGQIMGYGAVGWASVALTLAGVLWVSRVRGAQGDAPAPAPGMLHGEAVGES
jgi:hypothetical protein